MSLAERSTHPWHQRHQSTKEDDCLAGCPRDDVIKGLGGKEAVLGRSLVLPITAPTWDFSVLFRPDMVNSLIMKRSSLFILAAAVALSTIVACVPAFGQGYDLRGPWVGNAQGTIFGAEGSVTITQQRGEDLEGIVEGGNWLGKARFNILGKIRQNYIFGEKEGNTFQGYLYGDGTIRGLVRATDGSTFQIVLRRPYAQWGMPPGGMW